jgi:hypothetical protein
MKKLQYLCHPAISFVLAGTIGFTAAFAGAVPAYDAAPAAASPAAASPAAASPAHDYPTIARVEYVTACLGKNGGKLAALYQCSCAIDRIADALTYDDYVEASTYAKYATLSGAGGGIFRDSDQARRLAKSFRDLESDALRSCGL